MEPIEVNQTAWKNAVAIAAAACGGYAGNRERACVEAILAWSAAVHGMLRNSGACCTDGEGPCWLDWTEKERIASIAHPELAFDRFLIDMLAKTMKPRGRKIRSAA